jgi:PST family polysaccharide transporter
VKFIAQNKLYKVLSLNAASVAVSMVLGVFSTKIISLFLGTAGMALMGSFRNFATMLKSLATMGVNNSMVRLLVENKEDEEEISAVYATFFWIFLLISIFLGALTLFFSVSISDFLFSDKRYALPVQIFALLLPLMVLNVFWLAIYNGLELFRKIIVIQIVSNVVVFGIVAAMVWNGNIGRGLVSLAISELAMVAVTFCFIQKDRRHFRFRLRRRISRKYALVIGNFSVMALLSAVIVPLTLILIRNRVIGVQSIHDAGVWDGVVRLSGFYMIFFNTGLSLYYMPRLSALKTDAAFKSELSSYFKTLVPLSAAMLFFLYLCRSLIVDIAFTAEFSEIKNVLIWQLAGDFLRIASLAFGYQIVVKTMMKPYFIGEILFNTAYYFLAVRLLPGSGVEGVVAAYFYATVVSFIFVLVVFRKVIFARPA